MWDLDYTRTVHRSDGNIFTAYYFNDRLGKERYITGTIWDPGAPSAKLSKSGDKTVN